MRRQTPEWRRPGSGVEDGARGLEQLVGIANESLGNQQALKVLSKVEVRPELLKVVQAELEIPLYNPPQAVPIHPFMDPRDVEGITLYVDPIAQRLNYRQVIP